ncbi:MAG: protein kinase, partial [Deltaproteobacteria bacterium]|nr:protein kinase [Deltaproteobacteria bacterium]
MADPSPPVADSADPARLLALGLGDDDVPDVGEIDLAPFLCARPDLELLECLGRGGMGVVHKARQTSLDRWVAVKLMSPRLAKEPAFADRFAREARAMARLDHPGLVRVIDFGDADGLFYLVMEHVDGTDLRRMMAERLPTEQALAI